MPPNAGASPGVSGGNDWIVRAVATWLASALLCGLSAIAEAQVLPSEPFSLAGGRLVVSGEATASLSADDTEYFNYTDYGQNALRLFRFALSSALSLGTRIAVLSEVRTESGQPFGVYALFVRIRPWATRPVDLQIGRIPPTVGAFARRGYGMDNPLIGYPLAYQYTTSLRSDAVPANADNLLRMRGLGWRPVYPIGAQTREPGLPLMSALHWDTGIQVRVGDRPVQVVVAVTNGTLSNPRVRDENDGKQLAARWRYQPSPALILGVSAARGAFLSRTVVDALPTTIGGSFTQRAVGADLEYSRDHWVVRAEGLASWWTLPVLAAPFIDRPLWAVGVSTEAQYKLRPGLYVAGRADRLRFSSIIGTLGNGHPTSWDLPVTRIEVGGGYYVQRNVVAKVAYQHNWRDDRFDRRNRFAAVQLVYWF